MGREWARTRPSSTLVVIDHADRQQVERLVCLLEDLTGRAHGLVALHMQAALREFANPKPSRCPAVLHIGGERVECERDDDSDHPADHRNDSVGQGVRWSA